MLQCFAMTKKRNILNSFQDVLIEILSVKERAHIPHTPTLLENAAHNGCKCHTLGMDNRTENRNRKFVVIGYT